MDPSTTLKKLKEQAELNSMRKLQSLFNTPDQLEQIQQHLNRIEKKKNIVEAQLKSAIQSHFISVNSCMEQLQDVNQNLDTTRNTIFSIEDEYKTISHLETTLHELRQEAYRHKQLKSAKENMKNILDVDELAKKAHQHLEDNQLLFAHKYLVELEKCRNDILMELGDPTETNLNDINLVDAFFKEVKEIQRLLQNQIFVTIDRMLAVVRKDPKQLVTALRIIEREEILDEDWRKKKLETRFMPSDRPKKWKEKCFAAIKKYVENRVQGSRYKEREDDNSWFSKQLGNVAELLVKDLEVVKKLCEPCFPPSYKIFDYCVDTVHNVLSSHMVELLETNQLQGQEFFVLLSWQDTYKSKALMGNPVLKIDTTKIKDLLDEKYYTIVLNKHIEFTQQRLPTWFQNALEKNADEWATIPNAEPIKDLEHNYQSMMPSDINSMLVQQLQLIDFANDDRFSKATLNFLLLQLGNFGEKLREKITEFRNNHFRNTDVLKNFFVLRLVTIANDCVSIGDNVLSTRTKYEKFIDKDEIGGPNDHYQKLSNLFSNIASLCIDYIIEDMMFYLNDFFKALLTRDWLLGEERNDKIKTILATTGEYIGQDLTCLKRDLYALALYKWHNKVKLEYIKALLQNMGNKFQTQKCSDQAERAQYSNKIYRDILQMEQFFKSNGCNDFEKLTYDFTILTLMHHVIKSDDLELLSIEIGKLTQKAPEITSDMVYALLSLRGDISKSEYKENYESYVLDAAKNKSKVKTDDAILMFKKDLKQ